MEVPHWEQTIPKLLFKNIQKGSLASVWKVKFLSVINFYVH